MSSSSMDIKIASLELSNPGEPQTKTEIPQERSEPQSNGEAVSSSQKTTVEQQGEKNARGDPPAWIMSDADYKLIPVENLLWDHFIPQVLPVLYPNSAARYLEEERDNRYILSRVLEAAKHYTEQLQAKIVEINELSSQISNFSNQLAATISIPNVYHPDGVSNNSPLEMLRYIQATTTFIMPAINAQNLADLKEQMAAQEKKISRLEAKDKELRDRDQAREKSIRAYRDTIDERDSEIARLQKVVEKKDDRIKFQGERIQRITKDNRTAELEAEVNEYRKLDDKLKMADQRMSVMLETEKLLESARTREKEAHDKNERNKATYLKELTKLSDKVKNARAEATEQKKRADNSDLDYEAIKQQRDEHATEIVRLQAEAHNSHTLVADIRKELQEMNARLVMERSNPKADDDRVQKAVRDAVAAKNAEIQKLTEENVVLKNEKTVLDQARLSDEQTIRELSPYKTQVIEEKAKVKRLKDGMAALIADV